MKLTDISIIGVELSHDSALLLKQNCIDAIENFGIENFENEKKEIQLPFDDTDVIHVYISCKIYSEYEQEPAPFEPSLIDRSVHLHIKMYNVDGDEVEWSVIGEKIYIPEQGIVTRTPIDVEEEIIKYFTV